MPKGLKKTIDMERRILVLFLALTILSCTNEMGEAKQVEEICFYNSDIVGKDKISSCYEILESISINRTKITYLESNGKCFNHPTHVLAISSDSSIYYIEETLTRIKNYPSDFSPGMGNFYDTDVIDHSEFDLYNHFVICLEAYLQKREHQELEYIIPFIFKGNVERVCNLEDCRFGSRIIDALVEKPSNCVFVVTTHMGNYKILFHWHEEKSILQSKLLISDSLSWEL
jgi:hypothetical protein